MEWKDYITISISSVAFLFALVSFLISFKQRKYENERTIRKSLTDTISEIAAINVENAKLKAQVKELNDDTVEMRRIFNSQRRYLVNHAEYLLNQIPHLATDIDCNIIASAFNSIGDYDKANKFWQLCIEKSPNETIKSMNLRGYARFLYFQGNAQLGRRTYEESLQLNLPDTDNIRQIKSDTYLMWALTESDFRFTDEAKRLFEQAKVACERIGHKQMKKEMMERINNSMGTILSAEHD